MAQRRKAMQRFGSNYGAVRVTRMSPADEPGYRKKHYRAIAKTYCPGKDKFKYENFDGNGSTRVVVHQGYSLDVWDYYTRRAVDRHQHEVRLDTAVTIGVLGLCIVDAILSD
jgi:hypothetical protein